MEKPKWLQCYSNLSIITTYDFVIPYHSQVPRKPLDCAVICLGKLKKCCGITLVALWRV